MFTEPSPVRRLVVSETFLEYRIGLTMLRDFSSSLQNWTLKGVEGGEGKQHVHKEPCQWPPDSH